MTLQVATRIGPRTVRARRLTIEGIACAVHRSIGLLSPMKDRWSVTDVKSGHYFADQQNSPDAAVRMARKIIRTNSAAEIAAARRKARES